MTTPEEIDALIKTAKGEIGTHEEKGPNIGTCAKYQAVTGGSPGDSWCADFVCWCFKQIGLLSLLPRVTGSCEEMRVAARNKGKLFVATMPQPGDIGLVVQNDINHAHHMFLVEDYADEDTGIYPTIEGNSNTTGSSNGDGVYERNKRDYHGDGQNNHYEYVRVFSNDAA